MADATPLWYRAVGRVDEVVTPRADALVRSEAFAVATGLAHRAQRELRQHVERASRRAWHLLNLPAGSDVNRLLTQIASLERQVRELEKRLTDGVPVPRLIKGDDAAGTRRAGRPRSA